MIESQLPEKVLFRWIVLRALVGSAELLYIHCHIQRWICLVPVALIRPIRIIVDAINHRVESRIVLASGENVLRLLMHLPADTVPIGACSCDQEEQRLFSRVAGAVGHNVIQQPVWLGVELIENDTMDVQPVLSIGFCRQHLIKAVEGRVNQSLLGKHWLDAFLQRRALLHHLAGDVKDDGCLLPVCCAAVDLRAPFAVTGQQIKSDRCCEFALALFLRYFNVRRVVLPISVFFNCPENVSHNFLLPRQQLKVLIMPFTLCMFQGGYKGNGAIGESDVRNDFLFRDNDLVVRQSLCPSCIFRQKTTASDAAAFLLILLYL